MRALWHKIDLLILGSRRSSGGEGHRKASRSHVDEPDEHEEARASWLKRCQ